MEAKFEKKLKAFLPYIIIIGIVYLIVPALLFVGSDFVSYLVLIGILPLTAAGCCAYYSMKKENDFWLCLVAPIFFIPAMFLYPIFRSGALIALIYLVSYLLCGYLGLTIGDILAGNKGRSRKAKADSDEIIGMEDETRTPARRPARKPAERRAPHRAERRTDEDEAPARRSASSAARAERVDLDSPDAFTAEDPYADESLDASTTSDDIDAILNEIHQRRDSE